IGELAVGERTERELGAGRDLDRFLAIAARDVDGLFRQPSELRENRPEPVEVAQGQLLENDGAAFVSERKIATTEEIRHLREERRAFGRHDGFSGGGGGQLDDATAR